MPRNKQNESMKLVVIDFTKWNDNSEGVLNEQRIFHAYINQHPNEVYFPTGKIFFVTIDGKPHQFTLGDPILRRPRASNPQENRYEIINGYQLGSGGFGVVYKTLGTLIPQPDNDKEKFKFKAKIRAIKATKFKYKPPINEIDYDLQKEFEKEVREEAYLTSLIDFRRVKPVVFDDQLTAYTVMHFIDANSLKWHLKEQEKASTEFKWGTNRTPNQIIDFAIKYLRALQEQVHDNNVIHLDLKPDNILVEIEKGEIKNIYIIDFGVSKLKGRKDERLGGTREYAPPEMLTADPPFTNEKVDIYQSAVLLAEACGIPNSRVHPGLVDTRLHIFDKTKLNEDFTPEEKQNLIEIFIKMASKDPKLRASSDDALDVFENMRLNRKLASLEKATPPEKDNIQNANAAARLARKKLRSVAHDVGKEPSLQTKAILTEALNNFKTEKEAVNEFVETLGIAGLESLKENFNEETVSSYVQDSYSQFYDNMGNLLDLLEKAELLKLYAESKGGNKPTFSKEIKDLITGLSLVLQKDRHYKLRIDDINKLNLCFKTAYENASKKLNSLSQDFESFEESFNTRHAELYCDITCIIKNYQKNNKIKSFINQNDIKKLYKILASSTTLEGLKTDLELRCNAMNSGLFKNDLAIKILAGIENFKRAQKNRSAYRPKN